MIKIEITDPTKENPDTLVKLAAFLMECAGHTVVKAPQEIQREYGFDKAAEKLDKTVAKFLDNTLTVDELPPQTHGNLGMKIDDVEKYTPAPYVAPTTFRDLAKAVDEGVEKLDQSQRFATGVPYQHCAESGLTEISEEAFKKATNDLIDTVLPPPVIASRNIDELPEHSHRVILEDSKGNQFEVKGVTDLNDLAIKIGTEDIEKPIVSETKKSATKRKRTPKFEVIKETGVTEVVEDLLPPPAPVLTPMVNGNVLVDKILVAKTQGMITHDEITAIVRKHGLVAIKDIFTNDALIPAINADLDELLRSK